MFKNAARKSAQEQPLPRSQNPAKKGTRGKSCALGAAPGARRGASTSRHHLAERYSSSQSTAQVRWGGCSPSCTGGFPHPAFCIPIHMPASPTLILGKSRMRKRARTDLWGGG